MNKTKVAIVFGGRSTEHRISLLSAKNIIEAIDRSRFEPILIGIDQEGIWHYQGDQLQLLHDTNAHRIEITQTNHPILFSQNADQRLILSQKTLTQLSKVDVIFPVLHGIFGEDGSIQGLAKMANIPCVGCGILGSAVGMDKDITKRLLRDAGIAVADFITLRQGYNDHLGFSFVAEHLGTELFLKPANLGSSVGVSYVDNAEDYKIALERAFRYDPKVIVEEKIVGRELECAVLGNQDPKASIVGEVIPKSIWYSFENKYIDDDGARVEIPAQITEAQSLHIRQQAIEVFRLLECSGMARIDFFMQNNGKLIVNEINTIPGFTNISMYPKLWKKSGLDYQELISRLIDLAIEEHQKYELRFDNSSKTVL